MMYYNEGGIQRERNFGLNYIMIECKYLFRVKCQIFMNVSKFIFFFLVGFEKFKYVVFLYMDGGWQNKIYVFDYIDEGIWSFVD